MKEFEASRLSDGNKIIPNKISIDDFGVTLRISGVFSGKEKSLTFHEISSVNIDTPMVGFSTITFNTQGWDDLIAKGFSKEDAFEIKKMVQGGILAARGGTGNFTQGTNQPFIQQQKSAEQILAEAEAERIKHQIETEKQERVDKVNREFLQGLAKHWKIWVPILAAVIVGLMILNSRKGNSQQESARLSLQLEQFEDSIKMYMENGNVESALKYANQLVHPSSDDMKDKKFDSWSGYPKYNEYWTKKREEYKEQIRTLESSTKTNKVIKNEITQSDADNSKLNESINSNVNQEEQKLQIDQDFIDNYLGKYVGKFGNSEININLISITTDGQVISENTYKGKTTEMSGIAEMIDRDGLFIVLKEPEGAANGIFSIRFIRFGIGGLWKSYDGKITREFKLDRIEE